MHQMIHGDCLEELKKLDADSIDSLVTDPPAGISFMNKAWDSDKGGRDQWIAWFSEVMRECLRVMKPGAHGLVWALPRTSHWTGMALEQAGFEVRDIISHLFGQGFPKSLDVSKAIDKAAGVRRPSTPLVRCDGKIQHNKEGGGWKQSSEKYVHHPVFDGSTDEAKQWQGWGTALKPACEDWWLVRKPLSEKTVAANVLKWGTGGINIDGSRIEAIRPSASFNQREITGGNWNSAKPGVARVQTQPENLGRFPSNLLFSCACEDDEHDPECAVGMLDAQSGQSKGGKRGPSAVKRKGNGQGINIIEGMSVAPRDYTDSGGASRFFYCAKISSSERNAGMGDVKNGHPTVKAKKLMAYLIKLITPPNGIVLDPFMGSGSTGIAAKECGFDFIGIEKEQEYFEIAKARIG